MGSNLNMGKMMVFKSAVAKHQIYSFFVGRFLLHCSADRSSQSSFSVLSFQVEAFYKPPEVRTECVVIRVSERKGGGSAVAVIVITFSKYLRDKRFIENVPGIVSLLP